MASAHLRWAVPVLTAMVLAIAVGCASEPEVVNDSPKAAVRESEAASAGTESSSAAAAPGPTAPTQTPTPYPTLAPAQVQEVPDRGENVGPDLVHQKERQSVESPVLAPV